MGCFSLEDYVAELTRLVETTGDVNRLVDQVAPLKHRLLENADLVPETFREGLERVPYTRNLLYADPEGRFTVMAVVWGPGRETPVHDHESWGVVGGYAEAMEVTNFRPVPGSGLEPADPVVLKAGDVVRIVPPRELNIHKMANRGTAPSMTIHTYGDPARLCNVYDPKTGRANPCELTFHHVL